MEEEEHEAANVTQDFGLFDAEDNMEVDTSTFADDEAGHDDGPDDEAGHDDGAAADARAARPFGAIGPGAVADRPFGALL